MLNLATENKKDLVLAKKFKSRSSVANKWIVAASASAGGVGVTPIPFADSLALSALQISLVLKLANLYEYSITKKICKK